MVPSIGANIVLMPINGQPEITRCHAFHFVPPRRTATSGKVDMCHISMHRQSRLEANIRPDIDLASAIKHPRPAYGRGWSWSVPVVEAELRSLQT